jgi:hypothetical protein
MEKIRIRDSGWKKTLIRDKHPGIRNTAENTKIDFSLGNRDVFQTVTTKAKNLD